MKKLNTKKGFSLIELLVVIAIIGVLSAVGITAEEQSKKFTIKSPSEQVSSVLKMAKLFDFFTIT